MSELERLRSRLKSLESQKSSCATQRKTLVVNRDKANKRKKAIWPILYSLTNSFDNNCSGINTVASWMESDVEAAMKGISSGRTIESAIGADKEYKPESDGNLSEAIQLLREEYNDLQSYYDDRDEEIRQIDNKSWDLTWEIANVKKQILEEEAKEKIKNFVKF